MLKDARLKRGWTQPEAALRLGVSQAYLSMLESGLRPLGDALASKLVRVYKEPTLLPLPAEAEVNQPLHPDDLASALSGLGYPGFAYLKRGPKRNPALVLLTALAQGDLEPRLVEALPWLQFRFWQMNAEPLLRNWLVRTAKLNDLQNRLGFVTTLARKVSEHQASASARTSVLRDLELELENSKLAKEDTLCRNLSSRERQWVSQHRPVEARFWNLLTDLTAEHLTHVQ